MPKINITAAELLAFEKYLPPEIIRSLEDKILLASIPKDKACEVAIAGNDGEGGKEYRVITGIELTGRWAVAPAMLPKERDGRIFSTTRKALIHRPSGLAAAYGTKSQLLVLWNKDLDDKIKAEIELDDAQELMEASPDFVKIVRAFI